MKNAQATTAGEALAEGKTACPVCIPAAEQPAVYATKHGTCYHYDPVCSGMKNAQATTAGDALTEGKTPCPVCIPAAEQPAVYATRNGTYYHYDPVCSHMKNAQPTTTNDALAEGQDPLPRLHPGGGRFRLRQRSAGGIRVLRGQLQLTFLDKIGSAAKKSPPPLAISCKEAYTFSILNRFDERKARMNRITIPEGYRPPLSVLRHAASPSNSSSSNFQKDLKLRAEPAPRVRAAVRAQESPA